MNERTWRDRFHALGPLVLRIGIAAVLIGDGLNRVDGFFADPSVSAAEPAVTESSEPAAAATAEGVRFSADWGSMLGVGELGAAVLLVSGLLTRLVVLPILGVTGFGLLSGFSQASMPTNATSMLLLGVASVSLLVSGAGCLAFRFRRRHVAYDVAGPSAPGPTPTRQTFAYAKPPWIQRVRNWLGGWRSRRPVTAQTASATVARRWPWRNG